MTDTTKAAGPMERIASAVTVGMMVSADFYPEDTPQGFVEITLAVPEGAAIGAGLYELRFARLLTAEERSSQASQYAAIRLATLAGDDRAEQEGGA